MAEILSYDPSSDPEVLASIESDEAESLAIGEEMINQANDRLAGKYKNAQELEKAYMELEKKLGSKETTEEPQTQQDEKTEDDKPEDATVDFLWEVNEEYEKNSGKLSEETLEKFNSMSSKELVEAFFRYQDTLEQTEAPQAVELSEAQVNQIQNLVGGAQKYQQLVSWAAENFSPEEVEAFDGVVESGNVGAIKLALQALQYRYQDNMGYEGDMIQGRAAKARDAFKSQAEVVRAMNDPRYDRDPAYRNEIMEKLARSDIKF